MKLLAWIAGGIGAAVILGFLTSGGEIVSKMSAGGNDSAYALGMVFGYVVFGALLGALAKLVAKFVGGRMKGR